MRWTQNTSFHRFFERWFIEALDLLASRVVGPCDVFIGMSGMSKRTASAVRRKYGAQIWIERGSRHILSQQEILRGIGQAGSHYSEIPSYAVDRELADYYLADTIVVPSVHVERSFLERGVPIERLFRNPYGVDLAMFPATAKPATSTPTVLFVGMWSLRKGCDLLWSACQASKSWRLMHVGPIGDAPVPKSSLFAHRDAVPQWQLVEQFKQASVFALASREEGLSLVQAQALACGLPVVCTDRTGGEDLREMLSDRKWITVVPHDNEAALRGAIVDALREADALPGVRDILGIDRLSFSWKAYGERYNRELDKRLRAARQPQSD